MKFLIKLSEIAFSYLFKAIFPAQLEHNGLIVMTNLDMAILEMQSQLILFSLIKQIIK